MVNAVKSRRCIRNLKRLTKLDIVNRSQQQEGNRYVKSHKSWSDHVAELRPGEFKRRYRMSAAKFNMLIDEVAEKNEFFQALTPHQEAKNKNYNGCASIDPRHKLAADIPWFAGGNYLDIHLVHGMAKQSMYNCVWHAVNAINSSDKLALYFPWDDEDGIQDLELGFARLPAGKFRGCIFAHDGFCVRIQAPRDVPNVQDYYHRKKCMLL